MSGSPVDGASGSSGSSAGASPGASPGAAGPRAGEPRFEESLSEVERAIRALEAGDIPLEDSIDLYAKAMQSLRRCHTILDRAEGRLEVVRRAVSGGSGGSGGAGVPGGAGSSGGTGGTSATEAVPAEFGEDGVRPRPAG